MNAAEHRLVSAIVLAGTAACSSEKPEQVLPSAIAGGIGGYCCGTLPDIVEPAINPHHRQFFHSVLFGIGLSYGLYRLYQWEPKTPAGDFWRAIGLFAGAGYLIHLAMDATTARSLPMIGRIG
jgi:membrane-bound metal-dependent hydrolase YbcI (DUF457 family)